MNITYLLGAGASYNALPIVEEIPNRLNDFANDFHIGNPYEDFYEDRLSNNLAQNYLSKFKSEREVVYAQIEKFFNDIIWLKTEASNHTSIDTFAKKLYLQNDLTNLKKLKIILSCFFLYLQSKKFDKRYDSFFASILDSLSLLPENIKILTWNYDSQLEIAFSRFSEASIKDSKKNLNIHSRGDIVYNTFKPDQFCIYKINGTTNVTSGEFNVSDMLSDFNIDDIALVETFLASHNKLTNDNYNPNLTFAWEDFNVKKGFFPNLNKSVYETEILIVIGYSFPFFNRKIDKYILDSMYNLRKIYVQDPKYAKEIIEKINSLIPNKKTTKGSYLKPILYEEKTFSDQFFIPIEF